MQLDPSYFTYIKFPVDMHQFVKEANDYLEQVEKDNKFALTLAGLWRAEIVGSLLHKIEKMMPFNLSNVSIYKNPPNFIHKDHTDDVRKFVVNMLLVDNDPDFDVGFLDPTTKQRVKIPYIKNQWVMLNVRKWHYVRNHSSTATRYVINLGSIHYDYHTMKDIFESNGNIGLYDYNK